jgi:predicted transcriptional regulator
MSAQMHAEAAVDRTFTAPDSISSPQAKLVYLYLDGAPGATVDELHERLDLPRLSLFPVLDTLQSYDLVSRDGETYVAS